MKKTSIIILSLSISMAHAAEKKTVTYHEQVRSELPVAHWSFEGKKPVMGTVQGKVKLGEAGPGKKDSKMFQGENKAAKFEFSKTGAFVRLKDVGPGSQFDFDNGDPLTVEAWVKPEKSGGAMVILSKGRTGNPGVEGSNQNYAFRVVGSGKAYRLGFLFRSRKEKNKAAGWHRWTSTANFIPDGRWHHVALTYTFGKPKSILGFVDGEATHGKWDMDGETTRPPVVDNDELWVGSAQKGGESSSYKGLLDEVALYRRAFTEEQLATRYSVEPYQPKVDRSTLKPGKVKVEIVENLNKGNNWPRFFDKPSMVYQDDAFAFFQVPHKYNKKGLREDWDTPLLFRATAEIVLKKGDNNILLRTRGGGRLWMDGKKIAETSFPKTGGGAHNEVTEMPKAVAANLRRMAMGDRQSLVTIKGDGKPHLFVLEMIAGSGGRRPTLGETSVSFSHAGEKLVLMAPAVKMELGDDGWDQFRRDKGDYYRHLDTKNRQSAKANDKGYWKRRHDLAKQVIAKKDVVEPGDKVGKFPVNNEIDRFLAVSWTKAMEAAKKNAVVDGVDYIKDVKPILADQCFRCHAKKTKGGLRLDDRVMALKGGDSEYPAFVPGKPEKSYLMELIDPVIAEDDIMPPKGEPLSKEQREVLGKWIAQGANYSSGNGKVELSQLTTDLEFLRRATLDTVGVIPSEKEIALFMKDTGSERRSKVIDRLLADGRWADHWVSYWQDVLAENPNILKGKLNNTGAFRFWIHEALQDNLPMDRFVTELVMMEGSQMGGGPAGFGMASQNDAPMAAKTHVLGTAFLGIEMKCARCHDAPYHETKQMQLFEMAAMLNRGTLTLPKTSTVPASTFAGRKPLIVSAMKPGDKIDPAWSFSSVAKEKELADWVLSDATDSREKLAALITSPHNDRFAQVMVNRMWKRLMGAGFVEPVDDWEATPPVYPELLNWLADEFVTSSYDLKELTRLIMNSNAYQRKARILKTGESPNFAAPVQRRMGAEQVVDSLLVAAGKHMDTEELTFDADGTQQAKTMISLGYPQRAWEFASLSNERDRPSLALPRAQGIVDVLKNFGWTGARQGPHSERDNEANVRQPAILANGTLGKRATTLSDNSAVTTLAVRDGMKLDDVVDAVFLRVLTRKPTAAESKLYADFLRDGFEQRVIPESDRKTPVVREPLGYVSWSNHLSAEANSIMVEMEKRAKEGDLPTGKLRNEWRERMEDMLWAMMNSPEFIFIP
ncbi:MAG: DUF1553 domain-containing protein [Verrucomicrobia bacterium]|nr:DUF1553 domain-containing protein [Verrucomicrobiota bacterium]